MLHKRLKRYAYKFQFSHVVKPDDKPKRATFSEDILQRIEIENNFLDKVMFSDEWTFHLSGKVNRHNLQIWASEHARKAIEYQQDSPKVHIWWGLRRFETAYLSIWFIYKKILCISTEWQLLPSKFFNKKIVNFDVNFE